MSVILETKQLCKFYGAAALNYVDVYQKDQAHPHTELLKMLGVW